MRFPPLRAEEMIDPPLAIKWSLIHLSMMFFAAMKSQSNTDEQFIQVYIFATALPSSSSDRGRSSEWECHVGPWFSGKPCHKTDERLISWAYANFSHSACVGPFDRSASSCASWAGKFWMQLPSSALNLIDAYNRILADVDHSLTRVVTCHESLTPGSMKMNFLAGVFLAISPPAIGTIRYYLLFQCFFSTRSVWIGVFFVLNLNLKGTPQSSYTSPYYYWEFSPSPGVFYPSNHNYTRKVIVPLALKHLSSYSKVSHVEN